MNKLLERFAFKVKRAETPFYAGLKRFAQNIISGNMPIPRFLNPLLRVLFLAQRGIGRIFQWAITFFFRSPLFRSRCESVGKGLRLTCLPEISGHVKIWIGDNVNFFGVVGIYSGAILEEPKLIFGNRVEHRAQCAICRQ